MPTSTHILDRAIPRRVTGMFAAALAGALLCTAARARAGARLETAAGGRIQEASYALQIHFDGVVAAVATRQVLVNPGKTPAEGIYTFELPERAAVTGVEIDWAGGRRTVAAAVDARSVTTPLPGPAPHGARPDAALLRVVERDAPDTPPALARSIYELRVYPIAPGRSATVRMRWVAPLVYRDGRLSLRIPGRGAADNLAGAGVSLALAPPPGARSLTDVRIRGVRIARKARRGTVYRTSTAGSGDLVVEATPVFSHPDTPVTTVAAVPVSGSRGAVAVSVLVPPRHGAHPRHYRRVVVVADVSRSMGRAGCAAAARTADAVLAQAGASAGVEAVVFDRHPHSVLGKLAPNSAATRAAVARALTPRHLHNGTDLAAALSVAAAAIGSGHRGDRTLLLILTDGMLPLSLTPRAAVRALGEDVAQRVDVLAVTLVPDGAAVPDIAHGPLAALAQASGGQSIAIRQSEVATRAPGLLAEMAQPPPLEMLSATAPGRVLRGLRFPRRLAVGDGTFTVGWYLGAAPRRVKVRARFGGASRLLTVAGAPPALSHAAVPLTLSGRDDLDALIALDDAARARGPRDASKAGGAAASEGFGPATELARRELVAMAQRAQVATAQTALVAVDRGDAFARARLAFAAKWGPTLYRRLAPPPERNSSRPLRKFVRKTAHIGKDVVRFRPTGSLDRAIVQRIIRRQVLPRVRACYARALRQHHDLSGSATLVMEVARGEVQAARVEDATVAAPALIQCVKDAAYRVHVPRVALGSAPEVVRVARYPFRFRAAKGNGVVDRRPEKELDLGTIGATDPLSGVPPPTQ